MFPQFLHKTPDILWPEQDMIGKHHIAHKIYTETGGKEPDFARVERELEFVHQENADGGQHGGQVPLIFSQDYKVIHVAQIIFHPQVFLDEMVELVQIDIGKKL